MEKKGLARRTCGVEGFRAVIPMVQPSGVWGNCQGLDVREEDFVARDGEVRQFTKSMDTTWLC